MVSAFETAAREWSAQHPYFVEKVTHLEQSGVCVALFSSALFDIARRSLGLDKTREPGDIDLLLPKGHFGRAARELGAVTLSTEAAFQTMEGQLATLHTREAIAMVGSHEVQFMDPLSRLQVGNSSYNTSFTLSAVRARHIIETDEGLLPIANIADAVGMYAVLQRGGEKDDLHHAAILLGAGLPMQEEYTAARAARVGWDERVWSFIGQAAALTPAHAEAPALLAGAPGAYRTLAAA